MTVSWRRGKSLRLETLETLSSLQTWKLKVALKESYLLDQYMATVTGLNLVSVGVVALWWAMKKLRLYTWSWLSRSPFLGYYIMKPLCFIWRPWHGCNFYVILSWNPCVSYGDRDVVAIFMSFYPKILMFHMATVTESLIESPCNDKWSQKEECGMVATLFVSRSPSLHSTQNYNLK